jgi:hypothetical protein
MVMAQGLNAGIPLRRHTALGISLPILRKKSVQQL